MKFQSMITTALCATTLFGSVALAQSTEEAAATAGGRLAIDVGDHGSMRSKAADWMVMPEDVTTFGGGLAFLTARGKPGEGGLYFTDVVLTSLSMRRAVARRLELHGSATFIPKQTSFMNELLWQSAAFGARIGFGKRYAIDLNSSGGAIAGKNGFWASGGSMVSARKSLHDTFVLEGSMGGSYSTLMEDDRDDASWFAEFGIGGQMTFRVPNGMAATWVGTSYNVPVADNSGVSTAGAPAYDPQTRFDIEVGGVLSYIDDWDIWAVVSVVDRGDALDPATTLPILNGGFDQKQLLFGLTYHLRDGRKSKRPGMYMAY